VLIAVLVAFLCLPTLDAVLHLDRTPVQEENRNLASFPTLKSFMDLRPFLAGVEAFVNDHFGFRQQLLRWHNQWKLNVFNEFSTGSILHGQEGWLYWTSEGGLEDYLGTSRFDEQQLRDWQTLLETRRDWLAGLGIKYIFVIPPNKQSIYPEYIPSWLKKSETPAKLDQFLTHMKTHSTVEVLDLRPALLEAKLNGWLFLKTDTHWNGMGAFLACQQVADKLSRQLPVIKPLSLDAFDQKPVIEPAGDCARYLGLGNLLQETQQVVLSPRLPLQPLRQSRGSQHPDKQWPQPDPEISENDGGVGRAVVYRDSFAEAMMPFLGYHFQQTIYFGRADWDKEFMLREKPDVVIDEMVERFVTSRDPKKLLQLDALKTASQ
jgi:hypothetical protein